MDENANEVLEQNQPVESDNSPVELDALEAEANNQGEEVNPEEPEEKLYTRKQLDRQLEKRVRKERRKMDELKNEIDQLKSQFMQTQAEPERLNPNEPAHPDANLSPQEYARQVLEEERKQREAMMQQEAQQKTQQELVNDLMSRGRKKYENFEEVVNDAEYTPAMVNAALATDNPEDVMMYYADNWEKTQELAKKTPIQQMREVNRVARHLEQQQQKGRVSNAPDPGNAPRGDSKGMGNNYLDALQNPNLSLGELARMRKD